MAKAKGQEGRSFNISVIGLSGTEKDKGLSGVGKSCLCNRFIHQIQDKYYEEHISVLSQSDFAGRVINNDHFLYWGEVTKTDEGNNFTFNVVEQTEFVDDVSFTPFKTGRTDPYSKRCCQTKVQSAEKLMYICKDQLGMEDGYEQKLMPDGKMGIDGFLCCFDVSRVTERPLEKQVEYCMLLLKSAIKTKKPVVLVTTKNENSEMASVREVERISALKEFKSAIPLVETSAHENVNVETAFLLLAHMIDKSKTRTKVIPFAEAMKSRKEIKDVAREAFKYLLRTKVVDHKTTWASVKRKLEKESDYQHHIELFGTDATRKLVKHHTVQLREDLIKRRQDLFMKRLPDVLSHFLPDLEMIGDRSWPYCQNKILKHKDYEVFFIKVCDEPGMSWKFTEFVDDVTENRLPADLLTSPEAETCFRNYVNALQAAHRKEKLMREFRQLLEKHIDIPGSQLSENYTLFIGKECYTGLQEHERQEVYDRYQRDLKNKLKTDFQELLWERPQVFRSLNLNQNLREDDLNVIYNSLNDDPRFRKLRRLEDYRKVMLLNHVVFLDHPSLDRCVFHSLDPEKCKCTECQVSNILRRERGLLTNSHSDVSLRRSDGDSSSSQTKPLNLVILGSDGLASEFITETRSFCDSDEVKIGHRVFSLDYRPICGDVTDKRHSFYTPSFKPQGCVCVYSSVDSLEYIRSSMLKILEADQEGRLEGLPMIIMLAYIPYTQKELSYLRDNGKVLADSLRCDFVDIPDEDLAEKLKFYPEQIEQALISLTGSHGSTISHRIMEDIEADLRIMICMMCADPYPMDIALKPFMKDSSFVVVTDPETSSLSEAEDNVFTIDATINFVKQKIEVTATSYHGAQALLNRDEIFHGYILAYCPKRKSSIITMRSFAEQNLRHSTVLVLAVPENGDPCYNMNEHSHGFKEGEELARSLNGTFMKMTNNYHMKSAMQLYDKFLRSVWENHDEEDNEMMSDEPSPPPAYDPNDPMYRRPPAPLPTSPFQSANRSSDRSSHSLDEIEPVYAQPVVVRNHTANTRSYTPSPPPVPSSSPPPERDYYSSLHCVRPSEIKNRKNETAAWAINEPKRHGPVKSTTFPTPRERLSRQEDDLFNSPLNSHGTLDEPVWTDNVSYDRFSLHKSSKPQFPFGGSLSRGPRGGVQAPLAMPEKIEIADQYGTVFDAIPGSGQEADYASVDDALPAGKLHRIKSTSKKNEKTTDSEESEFSSLERKERTMYSKVNRKPTPHKKKHRHHRNKDKEKFVTQVYHDPRQSEQERLQEMEHGDRGRSNSPSEDSGGTGDELQSGKKKRRSIRKKIHSPDSVSGPATTNSVTYSDSEIASSPGRILDDEDSSIKEDLYKVGSEDGDLDFNESGNWGTWFKKKSGKDTLRTREKRVREDERRRQKDDELTQKRFEVYFQEKKQKEQQKLQKKIKKKDSKAAGQSESGISLHDFSMSPSNPSVPHFIEKCVEFIEAEGLTAEGIYRIPGNKAQVDLLTSKYTEDCNVDIAGLDVQVNAVATVLKAFFADLTDPLVPVALYDELIEASEMVTEDFQEGVGDKSGRLLALRGVFLKMHPLNFEVLKFLITHLHKVSQSADQNSMDSKNLARCWWPTLIRMEYDTFEKMTKYSRIPEEILQTLIEQCSFFFHSGNEV